MEEIWAEHKTTPSETLSKQRKLKTEEIKDPVRGLWSNT